MLAEKPTTEAEEQTLAAEFERLCHKKFKAACPQLYKPWRLYRGRWAMRPVKSKQVNKEILAELQSTTDIMEDVCRGRR